MSGWVGAFGFMLMIGVMVEVHRRYSDPYLGGWDFRDQLKLSGTWVLGLILFGSGVAGAYG